MEQEFDSTKHENKVDDSREGYQRPSYTKEYSSEGRPQRQRIRTPIRSAYPSDRQRYNSDREAGSFRPEGFGGALAVDGGADVHGGVRLPQQLHDPQRRVIPAKGLHGGAQLQPAAGDRAQAAPGGVTGLEDLLYRRHGGGVALVAHAAGVAVFDLGAPLV